MGIIDRSRHQVRRFTAGIAEHNALVTCAFAAFMVGGLVDALGDMSRLGMQENVDLGGLPMEAVLFIADVADCLARRSLELGRVDDLIAVLVGLHQARRQANLTGDDNTIGGRQRLAGDAHRPGIHPGPCRFTIDQIDDFV